MGGPKRRRSPADPPTDLWDLSMWEPRFSLVSLVELCEVAKAQRTDGCVEQLGSWMLSPLHAATG